MSIFEQAARNKLRFYTGKGVLTVEDLWDLPLTSKPGTNINLDVLAKEAYNAVNANSISSFVSPTNTVDEIAKLKFDILKHIIDTKLAERNAALEQSKALAQKQRILEIIAAKEDESLAGKSLEELKQLAKSL